MTTHQTDLQIEATQAIELCRRGEWRQGMEILGRIAEADRQGSELPGLFYSYLGYGIARFERRGRDGLALCKHAIKIQFYEAENYVNLARVYLLRRRRGKAVGALKQALKLNPRHPQARSLARQIGLRKRPLVPFLSRKNPVNRYLGLLRHKLTNRETEDADGPRI